MFLLFIAVSCGKVNCEALYNPTSEIYQVSFVPLRFGSVEELFYEHRAINEGRASEWVVDVYHRADFASLDVIYLPVALPDGYQIVSIVIRPNIVSISFLPIEPPTDIFNYNRLILLQISRTSYDDLTSWGHLTPLCGMMGVGNAIPENLIDGKYYIQQFTSNFVFNWGQGPNLVSLHVPLHWMNQEVEAQRLQQQSANIQTLTDTAINNLLPLTQTITVNLSDIALIQSIVEAEQAGQSFTMELYNQHVARQESER